MTVRVAGTVALIGLMAAAGCAEPEPAEAPEPWIVGSWVRVFPADGAPDTLTFRADQSIDGSTTGLAVLGYAYTKWKLGDPGMPDGLCMGEGDTPDGMHYWSCTGFRVQGDTLWLANQQRTVFLRLPEDGRTIAVTPWSDPRREVSAPVAGDGGPAPPAAFVPATP